MGHYLDSVVDKVLEGSNPMGLVAEELGIHEVLDTWNPDRDNYRRGAQVHPGPPRPLTRAAAPAAAAPKQMVTADVLKDLKSRFKARRAALAQA